MSEETISHHLLRRTARKRAAHEDDLSFRKGERVNYVVERAERGPWRYRVVRRIRSRVA